MDKHMGGKIRMDEALQLIAYQRDRLKAKDDYISVLEKMVMALGGALLVAAIAIIYLCY